MSIILKKVDRRAINSKRLPTEYDDLIIAIIKQAADDYRLALRGGSDRRYKPSVTEIESFFRSPWYSMLIGVDGEMIIERIKEEEAATMARSKRLTPNQAEYQKELRRINHFIKAAEERGYRFDKSIIPEMPSLVTKTRLDKIKELKPHVLYRSSTYLDTATWKVVTGTEGRKIERRRAAIKGAATRAQKARTEAGGGSNDGKK